MSYILKNVYIYLYLKNLKSNFLNNCFSFNANVIVIRKAAAIQVHEYLVMNDEGKRFWRLEYTDKYMAIEGKNISRKKSKKSNNT